MNIGDMKNLGVKIPDDPNQEFESITVFGFEGGKRQVYLVPPDAAKREERFGFVLSKDESKLIQWAASYNGVSGSAMLRTLIHDYACHFLAKSPEDRPEDFPSLEARRVHVLARAAARGTLIPWRSNSET